MSEGTQAFPTPLLVLPGGCPRAMGWGLQSMVFPIAIRRELSQTLWRYGVR